LNFIKYNDPLFSVIAILVLLLITALATHFLGQYKRYREQRTLNNLIKRYDFIASDDAIVKIIKDSLLPHETIFFIASSLEKSGDYERAINIYVELLNAIHSKAQQIPILFRLGVVYYKAGFMQRSLDVFLRLMRINYSNIQALEYLVLIYDKLKDYQKAKEVIEPLSELGHNTKLLEGYVNIKLLTAKFESKGDDIIALALQDSRLARVVIEYLLKIDPMKMFEQMAHNHKHNIGVSDLGFEYVCSECKKSSPLFSARCHSCNALLSFEVVPVIIKKVDFNQVKGFYEGN
jgi:tetratricopeptide (TPR) repeat protein